ncbi:hypothetical protein MTO96_045628, partial [Rhipicephalus appendiculatus]
MVVGGQQMAENWIGYSWSRKMEKYAQCLMKDRKDNTSIIAAMDIPYHAAVIPAYRVSERAKLSGAIVQLKLELTQGQTREPPLEGGSRVCRVCKS